MMKPDHPLAFEGMTKIEFVPPPMKVPVEWVECPKCKGHGMWILAIRKGGHVITRKCFNTRCQGPHHFLSYCGQCNGEGYVVKGSKNETCVHEYRWNRELGRCHVEYKCSKCGSTTNVDSSD